MVTKANPSPESDSDKLKRRNQELTILNAITEALNQQVDLQAALDTALVRVIELFGLRTGWIWLINEKTGNPYLAAHRSLPPILVKEPERMDGMRYCWCLQAYNDDQLDEAENISIITCTRLKNLIEGTDGLRYHATIPLYAPPAKKLGVLNVVSDEWDELSDDELRLLHTIGDLLSIAIERARLFRQSVDIGAFEERTRLARELHDTVAQSLTAITLRLESADVLLENGAQVDQAHDVIRQALQLTQQSLEETRRSVHDLRSASLMGRTLAQALEVLACESAEKGGLKLTLEMSEQRPLPIHMSAGLYRIAQEAINNVLKHADATRLLVKLTTTSEWVELAIEDDGAGFDPTQAFEGRYGLIGLNERARLMGGELQICSGEGDGTQVYVSVPLNPPQESDV